MISPSPELRKPCPLFFRGRQQVVRIDRRAPTQLPLHRKTLLSSVTRFQIDFIMFKNLFLIFTYIITSSRFGVSFNVDTHFPIIYSNENAESYFGYSVAFLANREGTVLLVGAPRANQSLIPKIYQPGTVFKCQYESTSCSEVRLDTSGNLIRTIGDTTFYDKKDNGWLGGSIDTNPDGLVVACAHRWKNQQYYDIWSRTREKDPNKMQDYHSNGMCYTITKELIPNTAQRHIPLIPSGQQVLKFGIPDFAFGMAGMSAHFTVNRNLLLGAPGVYSWDGKLVTVRNPASAATTNTVWGLRNNINEPRTSFMYFGYAVASGKFSRKAGISYVIGAPRYNYTGKVFVIDQVPSQTFVRFQWGGTQLGEYLGAAVCATDLNNDGLDDLIVGSPLYAYEKDEGRVYVFMNKDAPNDKIDFKLPIKLTGSKIPDARFGTALSNVGDINMDGYNDFAVGAPYENENGVVYIYHGHSKDGIALDLMQKIEGKSLSSVLRGFGISISRGEDVDKNNYKDIAIGSYESGNAVILRSSPVVTLIATITTNPSLVSFSSPQCMLGNEPTRCCNITICIRYESFTSQSAFNVAYKLDIDSVEKGETRRGFINTPTGKNATMDGVTLLKDRSPQCEKMILYFRKDIKNILSPVDIALKLNLANQPTNTFCARCPVLNPRSETTIMHQVWFSNGCKNEKCISDLKLSVNIIDSNKQPIINPRIWVDVNGSITFDISIHNSGDAAFLSELNITLPTWASFVRYPAGCNDQFAQNESKYFICDIGNPLKSKATAAMQLALSVEPIPINVDHLTVNFYASTGSIEHTDVLKDNNVTFDIPIGLTADLAVVGSTFYEYISYANISQGLSTIFEFNHTYDIINYGPSPLSKVKVEIRVPEQSLDGKVTFVNITRVETKDGHITARVVECTGAETTYLTNEAKERDAIEVPSPVKRKRRSIFNKKGGTLLFCDKAKCTYIVCEIDSLAPNDKVKITVNLTVDPLLLEKLNLKSDFTEYATEAHGTILNAPSNIQPTPHRPDSARVITNLDSGRTSPKDLPDWVIPVAIALGILLLLILAAVFYKLGFFSRGKRDEMKRIKEQDENGANERTSSIIYSSQDNLIDDEMPVDTDLPNEDDQLTSKAQ